MTINKSEKILSKVPDMPSGEEWVYQMGVPLQLSATEAGLFCSIRRGSVKAVDFEVGNDLIPFDSIDRIKAERAVPLIRSTPMCHPETGDEQMLSVYPVTGGFVPLGAKMDGGGRIHPHAGTGFGVCQILGYPSDLSREPGRTDKPLKMMGIQQYTYDGTHFTVSSQGRISEDQLYPGWRLIPAIMSNAIPDGEDLVCGMCGVQSGNTAEKRTAGVARWRYSDNKWSVIGFTPVAQQTVASGRCTGEPSLIRIKDGSLLFMARGVFTDEEDAESVLVWRSTDRGATWKTVLKKRRWNTRRRFPCLAPATTESGSIPIRRCKSSPCVCSLPKRARPSFMTIRIQTEPDTGAKGKVG